MHRHHPLDWQNGSLMSDGNTLIGATLGPYRIIDQIGSGGMATVYRAYQPTMDRYVAIKVLPRLLAGDPTFVARFEQEAKVIARLEHARILPVFDFGQQEGIAYIVMRYLDAGTLADRLTQGPLPIPEIARVLRQVAEGLDYAHKRGVIHRDIKPSNIMLDSAGDVYLTDFGISKLVEGTSSFTGSAIVGTPDYMSPEQGLGEVIDHRTDIYSMGVVLYQMALGRVPFEAETPMAVVIKHINEPLPLPHLVNPSIPEQVERVILKSLAKDRNARFQTGAELADALEKAASGQGNLPEIPQPARRSVATVAAAGGGPTQQSAGVPAADSTAQIETASSSTGSLIADTARHPFRIAAWALAIIAIVACAAIAFSVVQLVQQAGEAGIGGIATQIAGADAEALLGTAVGLQSTQVALDAPGAGPQCPANQRELARYNFSAGSLPAGFEEYGDLVDSTVPGRSAIEIEAGEDEEIYIPLYGATVDAMVVAVAVFPEAIPEFAIYTRDSAEDQFYAFIVAADSASILRVAPGQERIEIGVNAPTMLYDQRPHGIVTDTSLSNLRLAVQEQTLATYEDPDPLPSGEIGIGVYGGVVWIEQILICSGGPGPQASGPAATQPASAAGPSPVPAGTLPYVDSFDTASLDAGWTWVSQPAGAEAANGLLNLPLAAAPGAALARPLPDTRPLVVSAVFDVTPGANGEFAGLALINPSGTPIAQIVRGYCDNLAFCQGDAIYWRTDAVIETREQAAGFALPPGTESIEVLLAFTEQGVQAFYGRMDQPLQFAGEMRFTAIADRTPLRLALFASGGPTGSPLVAGFDRFRMASENPPPIAPGR